ncbi:MAG: hypothetical protein H0W30_11230 [Gemmatimonadaceae bacterium]|nr:hypothetical protein [Gemmatimonadaceae bacterium]
MSRLPAEGYLGWLHLALMALIILGNLILAGRMARWRDSPRVLATLSALAGLMIIPAVFIAVMSGSLLTGRALHQIAWVWPATAVIIAAHAIYATRTGRVGRTIGVPIVAYNVILAAVLVLRYVMSLGVSFSHAIAALPAAHASALELVAHPDAVMRSLYLLVPIIAPAIPSRLPRLGLITRASMAVIAAAWGVLILIAVPRARLGVARYTAHARDRLQERPAGDFAIGVKLFPTLTGGGPPSLSLTSDLAIAADIEAQIVSVYATPGRVSLALLDSLAGTLEESRRAGRKLIVALDLSSMGQSPVARPLTPVELRSRLADVERLVRGLRPDYLVPAAGAALPVAQWTWYLSEAAERAHRIRPRTLVMAHVPSYSSRDSALYAWAVQSVSGIDAIGFTLLPGAGGGVSLDAQTAAAERWMVAAKSRKEHWVLEGGGLPTIHGDRSHELALWSSMAWATRNPRIAGFIVFSASDYESPVGLRAPGGRVRVAARRVGQAVRLLNER